MCKILVLLDLQYLDIRSRQDNIHTYEHHVLRSFQLSFQTSFVCLVRKVRPFLPICRRLAPAMTTISLLINRPF